MDATWSVRMSDEMKEKISGMISESGLNSKDFLSQIIQGYELKMVRDVQPLMEADINELSNITGRINHIYINLCERTANHQKQKDAENSVKLSEKAEMLEIFNTRIKEQEEKLLQYCEETNTLKKEYQDVLAQCTQLNEICETNKFLVAEYRDKNDMLSGLLTEYKEYKSMIDRVKNDLNMQKELRQTAEFKLQGSESSVASLKNQLKDELLASKDNLQKELELSHILKEKEVLQVRIEYQKKLELSQESYSGKTRELLLVIEEMQKSSKKVSGNSSIKNKNQQ